MFSETVIIEPPHLWTDRKGTSQKPWPEQKILYFWNTEQMGNSKLSALKWNRTYIWIYCLSSYECINFVIIFFLLGSVTILWLAQPLYSFVVEIDWEVILFLFPEKADEQFLKHLYCIISFLHFVWVRCHTTSLECFQGTRLEGLKATVFSNSIYSVVSREDIPPGTHWYTHEPVKKSRSTA